MGNYKSIHIWEFPPTLTRICLRDSFRHDLFQVLKEQIGSQQKIAEYLNRNSIRYGLRMSYRHGNIFTWKEGGKNDRGKLKNSHVPLWVLIEWSKLLSRKNSADNKIMRTIERNIMSYSMAGKSHSITMPRLPIKKTPELVSVIFHFLGDGHIGRKTVSSSYRQMNEQGLRNFLQKLRNSFGEFNYDRNEFKNGRLVVPKVITEFYKYYFNLSSTTTFEGRVPDKIKCLPKPFLVASLVSFIVDEGHVWEVITIYSKNKALLNDVREIAVSCGYLCHPIREKYARGKLDCYRFSISSKSYCLLSNDIRALVKIFPTCSLAQKQHLFNERNRQVSVEI